MIGRGAKAKAFRGAFGRKDLCFPLAIHPQATGIDTSPKLFGGNPRCVPMAPRKTHNRCISLAVPASKVVLWPFGRNSVPSNRHSGSSFQPGNHKPRGEEPGPHKPCGRRTRPHLLRLLVQLPSPPPSLSPSWPFEVLGVEQLHSPPGGGQEPSLAAASSCLGEVASGRGRCPEEPPRAPRGSSSSCHWTPSSPSRGRDCKWGQAGLPRCAPCEQSS